MSSKCFYPKNANSIQELANQFSQFIQQAWNPLVDGGITADNLSPYFFHPAVGAGGGGGGSGGAGSPGPGSTGAWLAPLAGSENARRYVDFPLLHRTGPATIHQKKGRGIEFWLDTTDSVYGRACWVSYRDPSKQIGSAIAEDPISNTNPGFKVYANYGKGMYGTSGAFDWELHRAGVKTLWDDGTQIDTARKYRTSGQFESTVATGTAPLVVASATKVANLNADLIDGSDWSNAPITGGTIDGAVIGDLELGTVTLTYAGSPSVSTGENYNVAASIAQVFVEADNLGVTDNFDVTLPSAAAFAKRLIRVKITKVGLGAATVTIKSSSGTVEGVAAGTGIPLDATARSKVTYQSDGTNWWSV